MNIANAETIKLFTNKLYIIYRRLKVDVLEVRSEKLEHRNFNDTS